MRFMPKYILESEFCGLSNFCNVQSRLLATAFQFQISRREFCIACPVRFWADVGELAT